MASKYSVSLDKLIKEFGFETLYLPEDAHDLSVTSQDVNRPGLILAGRDDYFDPERVQFLKNHIMMDSTIRNRIS